MNMHAFTEDYPIGVGQGQENRQGRRPWRQDGAPSHSAGIDVHSDLPIPKQMELLNNEGKPAGRSYRDGNQRKDSASPQPKFVRDAPAGANE